MDVKVNKLVKFSVGEKNLYFCKDEKGNIYKIKKIVNLIKIIRDLKFSQDNHNPYKIFNFQKPQNYFPRKKLTKISCTGLNEIFI